MAESNPNPQGEEIDLGKLFQVIGKGFKNAFNAIGNLFKAILHYFILSLIFLRKNALIIGGATVIGAVIGYVVTTSKSTDIFSSEMIVDTNYKSGHRLYKQLNYLNTLVNEKDSVALGKIFNMPSTLASKVGPFAVEPYDKEKNLKIDYDSYMKYTDTIFTRGFTLLDYQERINDPDYRRQLITAYSLDKKAFKNLKTGVFSLVENDFFNKQLVSKKSELQRRKSIITKDLSIIDSLRQVYKKVAVLSAENSNAPNTSIDLSGKRDVSNKDIELFNQNEDLTASLNSINREMLRYGFIIDAVSDFDNGSKFEPLAAKKWFVYGVLGFLLSIMAILGLRLNTYLSNYEK